MIEIEFDEIAEPKALLPADLLQLVKVYGSYLKTADVIGASEAFVRQNCFKWKHIGFKEWNHLFGYLK